MAEHSEIKMEYPLMEQMAATFDQGAQQLNQTGQVMKNIAEQLEGGALLGEGGDAFRDAIKGKLIPAINKLEDKFKELQKDVIGAMNDMKRADRESKQMF